MGRKAPDMVGQTFGWLTVVERVHCGKGRHAYWYCRCECGGSSIARASALRNGSTRSCGCRIGRKPKHADPDEGIAYTGGWVRGRFGVMYPAVSRNEEALA